jgi:beta-lactamase superfamily II metal-dependent hydrolase
MILAAVSPHQEHTMRTFILSICLACLAAVLMAQQRPAGRGLEMYLIDVEGGNATLFVSPSGQSLLMDTGNGGAAAARDADRIAAAVRDAGLQQIDHLVTTHYHGDHFGGMAALAERVPIRNFIDHGPNLQPAAAADEFLQKVYPTLYGKGRHTVVKPGDTIPVDGLTVRVVSAAGQVIQTAVPGGGAPNPFCAGFKSSQNPDTGENAASVGIHMTYGRFRTVHLGDLTWNKEIDLMCPTNRLGTVDLFFVSHHGQPVSNAPILVHPLRARVALMNNGTRKGGQPDAMRVLYSAPGLEDLWQVHFSLLSGQEYTAPGMFIANTVDEQPDAIPVAAMAAPPAGPGAPPPPVHNGTAYWIKVSARDDGSFTVTNTRNGFTKTYATLSK